MFTDTTLTLSDLTSWCVSGKCYWNVTPSGAGEYPPCTSFPSVFRGLNVYCWLLSVLFVFHCLTVFLSTLNCTRQDILFWNGTTRGALIKTLCWFYGINRILPLYWNIERAFITCAVRKNRPKLDHNMIYSWKAFFSSSSAIFFKTVQHTVWPETSHKPRSKHVFCLKHFKLWFFNRTRGMKKNLIARQK